MENNYITALGDEADQKDMELLQKVDELERENEQNKHCIKELKKEILEQKHAIQDFEIERDHNLETIKNQNSLIEFYKKYKNEQNNNNEKKKFLEYEEKIKSLEESISRKDKIIEDLNQKIKNISIFNEKLKDIKNEEEFIPKIEKNLNSESIDLNYEKILENNNDIIITGNTQLKTFFEKDEKELILNNGIEIKDKPKKSKDLNDKLNIEKMLENPKHKLNNEIDKYKIEIESKNKEINELKDKLSKLEVNSRNELKAQTEYLNGIIEGYKKNIENIKDQKIKTEKDLNKLNEKLEIELGNCKIQLANFQYEMDRKIITYKKYINKLQTKLESLGFKFKDKKNHNKITFDKVNNIV